MALKYRIKTEKVFDGDEEVGAVHGLSFNAIVGLIQLNREAVENIFNKFSGREADTITEGEIASVGMDAITQAPLLVAQVIALASDAYDGRDGVEGEDPQVLNEILEMPVGLQVAFLEKIGALTFNAAGGAKKMLALAVKAAQGGSQGES
ncbi:hypothetical protein [Paracoccus sp. (in: a-proteobacteria)]|uniref:phage pre-tape measure protein n=1 Tax=Paracoccus sp. TaxID=267 RepID=UPI0026E0790B|nr:hypothetical protein [Paracoccus sp. (in: a-proteobacteria)]MDO5646301.1 hypothetical protein [Paracoccus sp. (in: a-proteobacteria)]